MGDMNLFPYGVSQSSSNTTEQHQPRDSFPISEYLLWRAKMHVNLIINELSNNVLDRLLHSFSNWPSGHIIHYRKDPPISGRCFGNDTDEVDSPAVKWLNKRVRHKLVLLYF